MTVQLFEKTDVTAARKAVRRVSILEELQELQKNKRIEARTARLEEMNIEDDLYLLRAAALDEWATQKASTNLPQRNLLPPPGRALRADVEMIKRYSATQAERVEHWKVAFGKHCGMP